MFIISVGEQKPSGTVEVKLLGKGEAEDIQKNRENEVKQEFVYVSFQCTQQF